MRIIYIRSPTPWPSRSSTTCPTPRFTAAIRIYELLRELNAPRVLSRVSGRAVFHGCNDRRSRRCRGGVHRHATRIARSERIRTHHRDDDRRSASRSRSATRIRSAAGERRVRAADAARTDFRKRRDHPAGSDDDRDRRSSSADGRAADGRGDRICARTRAACIRASRSAAASAERCCCVFSWMRSAARRRSRSNGRAVTPASTPPRASRWRRRLFRPHEVNGIAQPAQVLIPIEFVRRSS